MATWLPLISTDATLAVKEILEGYMVRFGIEEIFKDLKDVWGWGKQELRLLESNEAELVDRSYRPWVACGSPQLLASWDVGE